MEKQFKQLKFTDDFMFCRVMQNNKDVAKGVVESILGFEIGGIVEIEGQKSIQITDDGHGVRFDIYMKDDENKVYDIEMQTTSREDLARRSRYYQSMLDRSLLKKGQNYRNLNDSYIIFIMLQDVFGMGYNVYTFRNRCVSNPELLLGDGATRIFVNASEVEENATSELSNLISYIKDGVARDSLTERIEKCIGDAKLDPQMEVEFMTLYEMKEEAYNEGKIETAEHAIPLLLKKGVGLDEACEILGISTEEYERMQISKLK